MNNPQDAYREEAYELLVELETALMDLEEQPDNADLIDRVFRAMHTIKGSGAMFGFDQIAAFTHELETVFDLVREGRMAITDQLVNLSLSARDQIKIMLDASSCEEQTDDEACRNIIQALKSMVPQEARALGSSPAEGEVQSECHPDHGDSAIPGLGDAIYRIQFRPGMDLFRCGADPLLLLDELRAMGECTVIARTDSVPPIEAIDPESCYISWDVLLTTSRDENAIRDVFIFVEDEGNLNIQMVDHAHSIDVEAEVKKIGQILVERGDLSADDLNRTLDQQPRLGELLVDHAVVAKSDVQAALAEQAHVKKTNKQIMETTMAASIRVASEKLDLLVDLVGELVTVQARLSQKADAVNDTDLDGIAEVVEHLTAELRDNAMSMRMMPFGTTFTKFKRLVRDLSNNLGKEIDLTTSGGETELDKTVIERLNDPLVHILRNSIDHGIETPDEREKAGKSRNGSVQLSAEHSGAHVLIRISDDGAGLNAEAIRKKAVEKGLIPADTEKTEREIFKLIFEPGFSTTEKVTNVSGRGVGMDVVRSGIEGLRGSIEIDSKTRHGTTIMLKLPLTLAIIDGLLVEAGGGKYVLPLAVTEECVELTSEDVRRTHGHNMLNIRGHIVPYVSLRERFQIIGEQPDIQQVVISEVDSLHTGIVVDRVIGQRQIVIKTMSKIYANVEEISGATILGDGTVALILDIPRLIGAYANQTRHAA